MRYLYKKGDRVVSRKLKRAGKISTECHFPFEGYRVYFDKTEDSDPKLIFSLEDDLYPESPTYEQAKRELCRTMEALITHAKAHLTLMEESIEWAKKTKALMPPENKPEDGAGAPSMPEHLRTRLDPTIEGPDQ
jgi:hypothetical protein